MEKENLKRNFVGKKYDVLYNRNFSIWALLFGWVYFVYRKMFLAGFAIMMVQSFIISFFNVLDKSLVSTSYMLINLSLSLLFNSMYRKHVEKKVEKIIAASQSEQECLNKAIKKGGTSVGIIFLYIIITIIITLIFTAIWGIIILVDTAVDFVKDNISINQITDELENNEQTSNKSWNNSTMIISSYVYTEIGECEDFNKYIDYNISEKFTQNEKFEEEYYYEDGSEFWNEVEVCFYAYENVIFEEVETENVEVNNREWTMYKKDSIADGGGAIIYATTKVEDINIIIKYEVGSDVEDKEGALEEFNNILESIQYK